MDGWTAALDLLPVRLAEALRPYPEAEEIRLRLGKTLSVVRGGREDFLSDVSVGQGDLHYVMERATGASLHAAAPAIKGGYAVWQGLRIGICGEAVYTGGQMSGLRNFSSLAVRIPHPAPEGCDDMVEGLLSPRPGSVLICAPPGVGKTSFLRELIRRAADRALRIAVIDERNELSASVCGVMQFDLGQGSDVMVGVGKLRAAMMLLRGMNPQIIAMDEITQEEDLQAAEQIAGCGVLLFATVHGTDARDMRRRPLYKGLLERGIFDTLVTIRCVDGRRIYEREPLS